MQVNHKVSKLGCAIALVAGIVMVPNAYADMTSNIGVISKYILRGVTSPALPTPPAIPTPANSENDGTAVQGGVDYSHASGFYAGYWGSNLSYGNDTKTGFENDFYAGYGGKAGDFGYSIGLIQYYYLNIDSSDGLEVDASVSYGPFKGGMKYLTGDVAWGNGGDIYWTLGYSTKLLEHFTFGTILGYYTYEESGKFIPTSTNSSAFRHLDLSLSHPIAATGADMILTYVKGGELRDGTDLKDGITLGIKFGFSM